MFTSRGGEVRRGLFDTPYGQQELIYELVDGQGIFEGDIVLASTEPNYRSAGISGFGGRWPNAVVRVENTNLFNDPTVVAAMQHWSQRTSLRFQVVPQSGNRLRFFRPTNPNVCNSFIGMTGGVQVVNLGANCGLGAAIHEIGHAAGLFHEQSRTDRDSHVRVVWNCIQSGQSHNFNMFGSDGRNLSGYDINSVMHYPPNAFLNTNPGCTATLTRPDGTPFTGGSGGSLTATDVEGVSSLYHAWTNRMQAVDWDGDLRADIGVWRPFACPSPFSCGKGVWYVKRSSSTQMERQWGDPTDVPVPGDYDNDRRADFAVYRPSTGNWHVIQSTNGHAHTFQLGLPTSIPVPADYNGDRVTDRAGFDPVVGVWTIVLSAPASGTISLEWGLPGDIPVPSDYDGDGSADIAIWRRSTGDWFVRSSRDGSGSQRQWGLQGDIPLPADYDGDGSSDLMVWRPAQGSWFLRKSSDGTGSEQQWGLSDDSPVPGDYDGDRRADIAVWRPSSGDWFIRNSSTGQATVVRFGNVGDVPVP